MDKIRGVNLGNWLVLEKWMQRRLFEGFDGNDETDFCTDLPEAEKRARLKVHRDTFITYEDIRNIKAYGMNLIRIPVPHFIFGDDPAWCEPYVGCIGYLDELFEWCRELNLKILIDLHTVPDSQNGFDNGGICGVCLWHKKPENIERALRVLEMMAGRYKDHPALYGIQLLNEPIEASMLEENLRKYRARDPERSAQSEAVPTGLLKDFYLEGYRRLRGYLDEDKAIVFHDGFRLKEWVGFMQGPEFKNIVFDTHIYDAMNGPAGRDSMPYSYYAGLLEEHAAELRFMRQFFPVIVGEWSLMHFVPEQETFSDLEQKMSYRLMADMQLQTWERNTDGWIFWSYKVIYPDNRTNPGWSLKDCIRKDWFPSEWSGI